MSSATTIKEKGSNSRRSDTKGDLSLCTDGCSDGVADMGLSTTSGTVKEKDVSPVVVGRVHDLVKSILLLRIESRIEVINLLSHLDGIISELLPQNRVVNVSPPLLLWSVHVLYVRKTLSTGLYGDVFDEIKAIIKDIIICGIQMTASDEPMT